MLPYREAYMMLAMMTNVHVQVLVRSISIARQ
jgi:hypothetical protein